MTEESKEQAGIELPIDFIKKDTGVKEAHIGSSLEFEKFMVEPEAKKKWPQISKDMSSGNLKEIELIVTKYNEKLIGILEALKVEDSIIDIFRRKVNVDLALSLSREGFLRKHLKKVSQDITQRTEIAEVPLKRGLFKKKKERGW